MPLFVLSDRLKLRLTGGDRVRFLNGQVTNDVRKANANLSMAACILSAKGKMDALIFIGAGPDELIVDADAELKGTLSARLERYLIADEVTLEDVTERFALFHVTGESAPTLPNEAHWRRGKRFGVAGWDLFVPAAERESVHQLLAAQHPICDSECAERLRIEQGIPRWGRELTGQIIPVEAGLEGEAIDYAKGCYIGQEVISRMKISGQTNKRLCGLVSLDGSPLAPGMRLYPATKEREMGWITSATRSKSLGKEIALGFVKRSANETGTMLSARTTHGATMVEVVALPFR
jgi:folate-binding protein YgfZ